MFRKNLNNTSDAEFDNIVIPFNKKCYEYLENYAIPEYVAFYIANGYMMNAIWEESFDKMIHSASDIFNYSFDSFDTIKKNVISILKIKYNLNIKSENPLSFF